ncbi:MAG: hypothetical protein IRY83_13040 [Chloroflexi bacterium]|nr:hypothetical protein [Chloroflexota bacterium]
MSLWDTVRQKAGKAAAEAERQAKIARLTVEISRTRGKITERLEEMGQVALELYRQGTIEHARLEPLAAEISKLEEHIKALEDEIAAQRSGGQQIKS